MKLLLLSIVIFLLPISSVFAETKIYNLDLNNDGKKEIITTEDKFETNAEGIITVTTSDKKIVGAFSMPDHLNKVEFISLNNDGLKQIVAYSYGGAHYTNIAIYGYKDNKLYKIFENGGACGIEADLKTNRPTIKIGRANWDKKGWSYADEPLWAIYSWNGKEFIYAKELSSAPEMNEEEESERFVDKANSLLNQQK